VINPLLLESNINVALKQPAQATAGSLTDFYALIEGQNPPASNLVIAHEFESIPQYVEVIREDKKKEFLNLIRYLADRSKFPQIKVLVITSAIATISLVTLLKTDAEKPTKLLPVHDFLESPGNNSHQNQLKVMNSHKHGLFFSTPTLLDEQITEGKYFISAELFFLLGESST
jgi:hypothetical protein